VEIRYVIPTNPKGERIPFCYLHKDYRTRPSLRQTACEPRAGIRIIRYGLANTTGVGSNEPTAQGSSKRNNQGRYPEPAPSFVLRFVSSAFRLAALPLLPSRIRTPLSRLTKPDSPKLLQQSLLSCSMDIHDHADAGPTIEPLRHRYAEVYTAMTMHTPEIVVPVGSVQGIT
jgi:hypothetical protein